MSLQTQPSVTSAPDRVDRDLHAATRPFAADTLYPPPNHPDGTVHKTKAEADAAEAAHA